MTVIDFTADADKFRKAQSFVNGCIQRKGVRLPQSVAKVLEDFKIDQSSKDPTPNEVCDKLATALEAGGASRNDSISFATCIRSMLDVHLQDIEEFIRRGFGCANFGPEKNQFALVPKAVTAGASPEERSWNGGFELPKSYGALPSIGIAVAIAVPIPAWVAIAVAAAVLVYMIGSLTGGSGKSWFDQACDAVAKVFGW